MTLNFTIGPHILRRKPIIMTLCFQVQKTWKDDAMLGVMRAYHLSEEKGVMLRWRVGQRMKHVLGTYLGR
jgi:hypothetical protein